MATPKEQAKLIKVLKTEVKHLARQNEDSDSKIKSINANYTKLEKEIDKMDRIATLQDIVIERAKADNSADAENIKYQKGVIIKLRAEKYSQTETIEELTATINSPNFNLETNTELKNVIDSQKSMLTSLRRHISSYKEDIKHQWSVIDTQEKTLDEHQKRRKGYEDTITLQAQVIREERYKIRDLQSTVAKNSAVVQHQASMIIAREKSLAEHQDDIKGHEDTITSQAKIIIEERAKVRNQAVVIEARDILIRRLEEDKTKGSESVRIKALQQEVDRLSNKIFDDNRNTSITIGQLRGNLDVTRMTRDRLEKKLEQQRKTITDLQEMLKPKCSNGARCYHCGVQRLQTCW
jgi:chromosome segregation ATPase